MASFVCGTGVCDDVGTNGLTCIIEKPVPLDMVDWADFAVGAGSGLVGVVAGGVPRLKKEHQSDGEASAVLGSVPVVVRLAGRLAVPSAAWSAAALTRSWARPEAPIWTQRSRNTNANQQAGTQP